MQLNSIVMDISTAISALPFNMFLLLSCFYRRMQSSQTVAKIMIMLITPLALVLVAVAVDTQIHWLTVLIHLSRKTSKRIAFSTPVVQVLYSQPATTETACHAGTSV